MRDTEMNDEQPSPAAVQTLVENHREFLRFLERRVGDRAQAEDILQDAFTRGIERLQSLRDGESVVAWFYRSLAAVRVHRAREALRKRVAQSCGTCAEHGCFDCTCETSCH